MSLITLHRAVACPCCHGEKKLVAVDTDQPSGEVTLQCLHCIDGVVRADELDAPVVENNFSIVVPESLKRNEIKPAEKREHLRSMGVKNADDIEKIISEIYP
jgi:hypothetical protein